MLRSVRYFVLAVLLALLGLTAHAASAQPASWKYAWRKTDFTKTSVNFDEILSGGVGKDQIPAIDNPKFLPQAQITGLADTEPVVGLIVNGEAKAYPVQVLTWHEIVNDTIGGVPVAVTFCPLCNAAIVFDRRAGGRLLDFGTTGKLRNSDLVMYDRQTESWWQQFTGTAIIGEMTGTRLKIIPARLESYANFRKRAPKGLVLVPNNVNMRAYGRNPYAGYDSLSKPFLYGGAVPKNVAPLSRVVTVGKRAWAVAYLRKMKQVKTADGLIISWEPGQNSALDSSTISLGRDVGNVTVQRMVDGKLQDVAYGVDFAFAFHAFHPHKKITIK